MRNDLLIDRLKIMLVEDLFVETPKDEIGLDDGFQTVLGLDSVSFMELRMLCEREFRISVQDDDFTPENFSSINRLAAFVEQKMAVSPNA